MNSPTENRTSAEMTSPDVTVVIPTRNRRQLVLRALDSVFRQRGVVVEVVVVDDGGTDGTADAVRGLGATNVRVIRHDASRGVSAARNTGLRAASAPWVAFMDDDDIWLPDKAQAQLASLAQDTEARWSCVGAVHVNADLGVISYSRPPGDGDLLDGLLRRNVVPGGGSGVVVSTELARQVGGFDERISILADWDFYLRVSVHSPISAVDSPLLAYYVHTDSMFHDVPGVVRELHFLEAKYQDSSVGMAFQFDRSYWYLYLARMAHRLNDDRSAGALLWRGLTEAGFASMLAETSPRVGRLVRRLGRRMLRVDDPEQPRPPEWVHRSLREYATFPARPLPSWCQ